MKVSKLKIVVTTVVIIVMLQTRGIASSSVRI